MSAAQKTRSATGMRVPAKGREAAARATETVPAKLQRVLAESRTVQTAPAILSLLDDLAAIQQKDLHEAPSLGDSFWNRFDAVEKRLQRKLATVADLSDEDMHRMLRIVTSDPMLAVSSYPHTKRLRAILARVHDELVDRARQPTAQPLCTLEQAAAMDFEGDGGAAFDAIGTAREWHGAVGCHWSALSSAGIVMRMSSAEFREGACKSPGGIEAMHGMWENVQQSLAYFEALAKLLRQAEMRLLVTLSHSALHEPAAVEAAEVPA